MMARFSAAIVLMLSCAVLGAQTVNVCDRTEAVKNAILTETSSTTDVCSSVLVSELEAITELTIISGAGITSLQAGDFEGLPGLELLNLSSNHLAGLPSGLFARLGKLRSLNLRENRLTALPADVFAGLAGLTILNLADNDLSTLPAVVFAELSSLRTLDLSGNSLSTFPDNVFGAPTGLWLLNLSGNDLSTLPDNAFSRVPALQVLDLAGNDLSELPDGVFAGLTNLQGVRLDGNSNAPFTLTVEAEIGDIVTIGDPPMWTNSIRLTLSEGAPRTITANFGASGVTSLSIGSLVIPAGGAQSEVATATRPVSGNLDLTLESFSLGGISSNYGGLAVGFDLDRVSGEGSAQELINVCGRTAEIRDAILAATPSSDRCEAVSPEELAGVGDLGLGSADDSDPGLADNFESVPVSVRFQGGLTPVIVPGRAATEATFELIAFDESSSLSGAEQVGVSFLGSDAAGGELRFNPPSFVLSGDQVAGSELTQAVRISAGPRVRGPLNRAGQRDAVTLRLEIEMRNQSTRRIALKLHLYPQFHLSFDPPGVFVAQEAAGVASTVSFGLLDDTSLPVQGESISVAGELAWMPDRLSSLIQTVNLAGTTLTRERTTVSVGFAPQGFAGEVPSPTGFLIAPTEGTVSHPAYAPGLAPAAAASSERLSLYTRKTSEEIYRVGFSDLPLPFGFSLYDMTPYLFEKYLADSPVHEWELGRDLDVPVVVAPPGRPADRITVSGTTRDGNARAGTDYEAVAGMEFIFDSTTSIRTYRPVAPAGASVEQSSNKFFFLDLAFVQLILNGNPGLEFDDVTILPATAEIQVRAPSILLTSDDQDLTDHGELRLAPNSARNVRLHVSDVKPLQGSEEGVFKATAEMGDGSILTVTPSMFRLTAARPISYLMVAGGAWEGWGTLRVVPVKTFSREQADPPVRLLNDEPAEFRLHVTREARGACTGGSRTSAGIRTLRMGDLAGLDGLRTLDLRGGGLKALPAGVFSGLTELTAVCLDSDPGFTLMVRPQIEAVPGSQLMTLRLVLREGAPRTITVRVVPTGVRINDDNVPRYFTIPAGGTESEAYVLAVETLTGPFELTLSVSDLGGEESDYSGITIATEESPIRFINICARTEAVKAAILDATFTSGDVCGAVSVSELRAITGLDLSGAGIASLQADDFSGLTGLRGLDLSDNGLDALPDGVFSGLTELVELRLDGNPGSRFTLTARLDIDPLPIEGASMAKLVLREGAPRPITVRLVSTGVTVSTDSLTIPTGSVESGVVEVNRITGGATPVLTLVRTISTDVVVVFESEQDSSPSLTVVHATVPEVILGGSDARYAGFDVVAVEPTGICDRTPQVQDAILARLERGEDECATVTSSDLAGITGDLALNDKGIESLRAGDFAGLTNLQGLLLQSNRLTTLPAGIFSGLANLNKLELVHNPNGFEFTVRPRLEPLAPSEDGRIRFLVRLVMREGASRRIDVGGFAATNATLSRDELRMEKGETESRGSEGEATLTLDPGSDSFELTFNDRLNLDGENDDYDGGRIVAGEPVMDVCDRTDVVRATILGAIHPRPCDVVPVSMLTAITELDVWGRAGAVNAVGGAEVRPLRAHDFAGLIGLQELNLERGLLTELPPGVFSGSPNLRVLNLNGNSLGELPPGVFSGLPDLQVLNLEGNRLTGLPDDVFSGLAGLQSLDLSDNDLSELSAGVFSESPALAILDLSDNDLSDLPAGVFSGSPALAALDLSDNGLHELPAGVFSGLPHLEGVRLGGNPGAPFALTAGLEFTPSPLPDNFNAAEVRLALREGAPRPITANLAATGATLSPDSLTIPTGSTRSDSVSITRPSGGNPFRLTLTSFALGGISSNYNGFVVEFAIDGAESSEELVNLCGRTRQVRDAILAEIPADIRCEAVPADELAGVTRLELNSTGIMSLRLDDFAGLTGLQTLDLRDNDLLTLPAGVFSGLAGLTGLRLEDNPGSDFTFMVRPKVSPPRPSDAPYNPRRFSVKLELLEGAPRRVTASLTVTGATLPVASLAIPPGGVESEEVPMTLTPGSTSAALGVGGLMFGGADADYGGFNIAGGEAVMDVCARTDAVKMAILASTAADDFCGAVSVPELTEIAELNLAGVRITSLQPGDFSGLTSLRVLRLESNRLSRLTEGVFSGLISLQTLNLSGNDLEELPAGVFSGLISLQTLNLSGNDLEELSAGVFSGLISLQTLNLSGNDLEELSAGVFSGLISLQTLNLSGNDLEALSASVFSGLTGLTRMDLSDNPGSTFTLTVRPEFDPSPLPNNFMNARVKLVLSEGAPRATTVLLVAEGADLSPPGGLLTIPTGGVESDDVVINRNSGDFQLTLELFELGGEDNQYPGITIVTAPPIMVSGGVRLRLRVFLEGALE